MSLLTPEAEARRERERRQFGRRMGGAMFGASAVGMLLWEYWGEPGAMVSAVAMVVSLYNLLLASGQAPYEPRHRDGERR